MEDWAISPHFFTIFSSFDKSVDSLKGLVSQIHLVFYEFAMSDMSLNTPSAHKNKT